MGLPCFVPRVMEKGLLIFLPPIRPHCPEYNPAKRFTYLSSTPCVFKLSQIQECSTESNAFLKSTAQHHS
eukprot:4933749-Karenia_brevis.AAC.1